MSLSAPIRDIVIVGGGTAGWMTAAAFAQTLARSLGAGGSIRLVESDEIGIIGVGEATIPNIIEFNRAVGIPEDEFMRATRATFKLGIEFVNWGAVGDRYIHGFGTTGQRTGALPFHHFWLRQRKAGHAAPLGAYSLNVVAAEQARFAHGRPDMPGSPLADLAHAYHFDAGLYARYLRSFSEQRGVQRIEGRIAQVEQTADGDRAGHIAAVVLEDGTRIAGDFFIDCSGMRGLLLQQALEAGYEDWSHWLPCDRAIAVPCASVQPLTPYTRSTAHAAGWQWRIPLQHRIGNGHVYSSRFMDKEEAERILLGNLDGAQLAEPRHLSFRTGRAKRFWIKNCVGVGLSSGFLEPLESTSIHLIHMAIARILDFFPRAGFDDSDIDSYNELTALEFEKIRDFLILHYKLTTRDDSAFWSHCREMQVPASLQRRMALFQSNGRVFRDGAELFVENSWLQVMVGQGLEPRAYHPFADLLPEDEVQAFLDNVKDVVSRCAAALPGHADFIERYCAAKSG